LEITLYTTGCPKCKILEKKLDAKNIVYKKVTNIEKIIMTGFLSSPILKVDDKFMPFTDAIYWVNGEKEWI
jgi:glutaredoxin